MKTLVKFFLPAGHMEMIERRYCHTALPRLRSASERRYGSPQEVLRQPFNRSYPPRGKAKISETPCASRGCRRNAEKRFEQIRRDPNALDRAGTELFR